MIQYDKHDDSAAETAKSPFPFAADECLHEHPAKFEGTQ